MYAEADFFRDSGVTPIIKIVPMRLISGCIENCGLIVTLEYLIYSP